MKKMPLVLTTIGFTTIYWPADACQMVCKSDPRHVDLRCNCPILLDASLGQEPPVMMTTATTSETTSETTNSTVWGGFELTTTTEYLWSFSLPAIELLYFLADTLKLVILSLFLLWSCWYAGRSW